MVEISWKRLITNLCQSHKSLSNFVISNNFLVYLLTFNHWDFHYMRFPSIKFPSHLEQASFLVKLVRSRAFLPSGKWFNDLELPHSEKYISKSKNKYSNWIRAENFDINFSVFLATSANYLLKEGRLDTN